MAAGLWWASALTALARIGEVQTWDGDAFTGHVRCVSNTVIVVDIDHGRVVPIELSQLRTLVFAESAPPPWKVPPAAPTTVARTDLPAPWASRNVGAGSEGSVSAVNSRVFQLRSAGGRIAESRDTFQFMCKPVRGDTEIVARMVQVRSSGTEAQAGLMMRASLEPDAPNVCVVVNRQRGWMQWREGTGARTTIEPQAGVRGSGWIRLKRSGATFAAYTSNTGRKWRSAGEVIVAMGEPIYVGLVVSGGLAGAETAGTFDQVQEAPAVRLVAYDPRLSLRSGSTVVGRIQKADPAGIRVYGIPSQPAIATPKVASLLFRWMPESLVARMDARRSGVLLTSGEFVEGEFRAIDNDRVTISSVLFGLRTYDVNNDVMAVMLGGATSPKVQPQYRVKLVSGSVLLAARLTLDWNEVVVQEPVLGTWRLPLTDVREMEALTGDP